jgi:peroxiredoxin family protein
MATQPLYIVLSSADRDKMQLASMIASVAAVSERPVHVFVSMGAIKAFDKAINGNDRYDDSPLNAELCEKNAPDPIEMFAQGKMLGDMTVWACSMVLDILGWDESNLVDDLFDGQMGLTKYLSDAEDGQLMTL